MSLVPMISGTSTARPPSNASSGDSGSRSPSTTGAVGIVPGWSPMLSRRMRRGAEQLVRGGGREAPRAGRRRRPGRETNPAAQPRARSWPNTMPGAELSAMARWNRPRAAGVAISVVTEIAPADSPKIVTCPGSPPKAAMLSRTHSRAAIWSRSPRFDSIGPLGRPVAGEVEVAERAEAVVDADETHVAAAHEVVAAVGRGRRRADDERAAVEPDHHGARLVGRGGRGADVERQAVLAHRRVLAGADELADALLDRHGPVPRAVARALPRHHGLRGAQAAVADRAARRRGRRARCARRAW